MIFWVANLGCFFLMTDFALRDNVLEVAVGLMYVYVQLLGIFAFGISSCSFKCIRYIE